MASRTDNRESVTFTAGGDRVNCVVTRRTPYGPLTVSTWGPGQVSSTELRRTCSTMLDAIEAIAETCEQMWPACRTHEISAAKEWHRLGFADGEVQAWLEVGVFSHLAAGELRLADIGPRSVAVPFEFCEEMTLGHAYALGEVRLQYVVDVVLGRVDDASE